MPRETIKNDVPIEWRRRYKAGLCPVCSKVPEEFDKGQKIFCSVKCREDYASKFTTWDDLRTKALKLYGAECAKCGISNEKYRAQRATAEKERVREWMDKNKDLLEHKRDELMIRLDGMYREEFDKLKDDVYVAEHSMTWEEKRVDLPYEKGFEVDHRTAIVNGGEMWDIDNLQVLCSDCHKEKTKKDLGERKIKRVRSKHIPLGGD